MGVSIQTVVDKVKTMNPMNDIDPLLAGSEQKRTPNRVSFCYTRQIEMAHKLLRKPNTRSDHGTDSDLRKSVPGFLLFSPL